MLQHSRNLDSVSVDFTVADILMVHVLSGIRDERLIAPYQVIASYRDRCLARPAWERTIEACSARVEAGEIVIIGQDASKATSEGHPELDRLR